MPWLFMLTIAATGVVEVTAVEPHIHKTTEEEKLAKEARIAPRSEGSTEAGTGDPPSVPESTLNLKFPFQHDGTWTQAMGPNDDWFVGPIALPFTFCLYGTPYSSAYINNNGSVSFGAGHEEYVPTGFPTQGFRMVAAFWADVDTRPLGSGLVWYKYLDGDGDGSNDTMIVTWDHVGYFREHDDKINTFQIAISDGSNPAIGNSKNVCFSYDSMEWTTGDASNGEDGFGGSPATVGANAGNGLDGVEWGRYSTPGVSALNGTTLCFSTCTLPDIRVDSNNNGEVDISNNFEDCIANPSADDCVENKPELHKGLLLPINNNDSDGDGLQDYYDTAVNGAADQEDLRDCYIRYPLDTGTIRLTVEPESTASLFRLYDSNLQCILGASAFDAEGEPLGSPVTEACIPTSSITDWTRFRIEGVDRGVARIKATYLDGQGQEGASDTVKVVVFRVLSGLPDEPEEDGVSGTIPADDESVGYSALVDFVDEGGNPVLADDGSVVQWEVEEGTATLSDLSSTTSGGIAASMVTASTVPGSNFLLSSRLAQLKLGGSTFNINGPRQFTPQVITVPGRPWTVTIQPDAGLNSYPANLLNTLRYTVTATDRIGNPVPDGTYMGTNLVGGAGIDTLLTDQSFDGGIARVTLRAGFAPEPEQLISVYVGDELASQSVAAVPLDIRLYPVPASGVIPIKEDAYFDIVAQVDSTDGSPVENDTKIVWIASMGSLSSNGISREGPIAVSTVENHQTTIRLFTVPSNTSGQSFPEIEAAGHPWVIAANGLSQARLQLAFDDPCDDIPPSPEGGGSTESTSVPVRLVMDYRALAGDATENGTVVIDDLTSIELLVNVRNHLGQTAESCPDCDLDEDGQITLVDLVRARGTADPTPATAPYFAQTQAAVFGSPGETIDISVSDPTLVELVGLNPDGTITLDASGQASFGINSRGVLIDDAAILILSARRLGAEQYMGIEMMGDDPCAEDGSDVPFVLLPKDEHGLLYNFFAGAVWGGGSGAAAFAGDAIVSFFVIGDIRDEVVELAKLCPGGEDPDGLTMAIAGVGIFTALGGPADAAITLIKRVLKKIGSLIPGTGGAKLIVKVIADLIKRFDPDDLTDFLSAFDEWKTCFKALLKNDNLVRLMAGFDETVLESCRKLFVTFGESFAGRITYAAAHTSMEAAKKAIKVMDALDEATIAIIKGKPQAAQDAIVKGLAECQGRAANGIWKGIVDDHLMIQLLSSQNRQALEGLGYNIEECVAMVGTVARNQTGPEGAEGITEFMKKMVNILEHYQVNPTGNLTGLKGHLNELRECYNIVSNFPDLKLIDISFNPGLYGVENIDAVAEEISTGKRILFEFKRGYEGAKMSNMDQKDKFLKQIQGRISLVKAPGHDLTGAEIRVWLNDTTSDWGKDTKLFFTHLGEANSVTIVLTKSPHQYLNP